MKVAIVYDRVNKWGGAERVLIALHELFPDAPLFTSVYNSKTADWAKVFPKIIPSFTQRFPFAKIKHERYPLVMPLAFESFDFSDFDVVISVTSEAAKGIITKPETLHICYCLTPTRYLWSGYDFYFPNVFSKLLASPAIGYLRKWDKIAAQRPDIMVAISSEVQERIKKYYSRDSQIIFPPLEDIFFESRSDIKRMDFYLIVSRLVSYKRVDLAVKAFNKLGKKLVVVGKGSELGKLRSIAKDNIVFTGELTDRRLIDYYERSLGLIMPQFEDFGLTALEAQACGTPVIAYKGGGAEDTVKDGITGVFFDKQEADSLIDAITRFEQLNFDRSKIRSNAGRFSKSRFKHEFLSLIHEHFKKDKKDN